MRWIQNQHLRYMQFPLLSDQPGIWHGISARFTLDPKGGRSAFNLGLNGNDPDRQIWRNRRSLMAVAGARCAVFARQVHGSQVAVVEAGETAGRPDDHLYFSGDALVTDIPGTLLLIQTADCQGLLLFDPVRRVVGNVHSGWRGSIRNVVAATVQVMSERYGCRPEQLICAIGPSLGPCCAEFVNYRNEIPSDLWKYRREGDFFDFWQLTLDQLVQAGVTKTQITPSGICTRCNRHLFFSYRGEGGQTGRFAAAIMLKE